MKWTLRSVSLAIAVLGLPMLPAHAAGQYDGSWYVDAGPAGQAQPSESSGCDAVRIPFQVTDNKISGTLQRAPYGTGRVEQGSGSSSSPITGTVAADGTVNAQWEKYKATGKLAGDKAQLKWRGECGERVATGGRASANTGSSR